MYTLDVSQPNFSQIGVTTAEKWIFFDFISSKSFKHDFLKSTFFKIHILYARFSGSIENMSCILLEHVDMGTQFCGKVKIHFSDVGNLFLERITNVKFVEFLPKILIPENLKCS